MSDAAFALDAPGPTPWSLKASLAQGLWPPLVDGARNVSVAGLIRRLAPAGAELRKLSLGGAGAWAHIDRSMVVEEVRQLLRDPAIVRQRQTDLCGPFAIIMELARRDPAHYVRVVTELFDHGRLPVFDGSSIDADAELRIKPLPPGEYDGASVAGVDWIVAATIREDENVFEDIDDGRGLEAFTLPGAIERWVRDILGLRSELFECYTTEELEALQRARAAVDAGGVALMFIDANLLKDGTGDTESDMYWSLRSHRPRQPVGATGARTHSKDDATFIGVFGNHWVTFLGGLTPADPSSADQLVLQLWSWGSEFAVSGLADDFGEYLYAVVTGWPS